MRRREFLKTATATAVLTAVLPAVAGKTPTKANEAFADVNGQHVFYSVHGAGKPLVLLHGGIDPDSFGRNLAELAKGRKVIAPHLQGHGRTPDTARPLREASMADDIAALIRQLKLGKADVMGYSMGSGVALQIAIRHPELVDRLVLVSAAMALDGFYPEGVTAFKQLEANAATYGPEVKASPLGKTYPNVDWTNLFRKVGEMANDTADASAEVAKLKMRTLLVYADADAIRPEHIVAFWKALGGGQRDAGVDGSQRPANQLGVIPNTTHYTIPVDPMLAAMVERFLGAA